MRLWAVGVVKSGCRWEEQGPARQFLQEQMANISFLYYQLAFGVLHFIFTLYIVCVQTLSQLKLIITFAYRAKKTEASISSDLLISRKKREVDIRGTK